MSGRLEERLNKLEERLNKLGVLFTSDIFNKIIISVAAPCSRNTSLRKTTSRSKCTVC